MSNGTVLFKTEIIIQGYNDNKPLVFSNLVLHEAFISVNHFSFSVRADDDKASLDAIINFKKTVLGKDVQVAFKDGDDAMKHSFKGIVLEVNSSLIDDLHYEFHISGSGLFCKVDKVAECHSFYKKNIDDILNKAFKDTGLKSELTKQPQFTKALHYTVQYNQTLFGFSTSLAIRYGEWMYYDGEKLQFGKKPDDSPVVLQAPGDVHNLNIHAHLSRSAEAAISTDIYKGENITATKAEQSPDSTVMQAAATAGKKVLETWGDDFIPMGFNQDTIENVFRMEQQAGFANSATITGSTRNNQLRVGKIIKIKDKEDAAGKNFIIISIHHNAMKQYHYSNSFIAIPFEAEVPHYTNPRYAPKATPQVAIVTDNEDDAGMARIKVKFSWMKQEEKTPWISVVVPHAGKEKGFRFLPEKDDEVMVNFTDNNAEHPYVVGAVYTEKNKPDIPEGGNDVKIIGTRSGRRLEIDDKKGLLKIYDNKKANMPLNALMMERSDEDLGVIMRSSKAEDQYTTINMRAEEGLAIYGVNGNTKIVTIKLMIKDKKISILSKGSIDIKADGAINLDASEINMNAKNINIKADEKLQMEGTMDVAAKGMNVKIEADVNLEMKGTAQAKLGGAKLDLAGDGIASLTGGLVKIN